MFITFDPQIPSIHSELVLMPKLGFDTYVIIYGLKYYLYCIVEITFNLLMHQKFVTGALNINYYIK